MSKSFMINRRTALGGALGGAAALAAGSALPAYAQDNKRIVVGSWGGDYSRLLAKNIETPLLAPEGWDVVKDEANAPPRRAKMMAEKALRRGTSDVQGLSANDMSPGSFRRDSSKSRRAETRSRRVRASTPDCSRSRVLALATRNSAGSRWNTSQIVTEWVLPLTTTTSIGRMS